MPQEKRYASAAERQKAYRDRQRAAQDVDPSLPVRDVGDPEPEEFSALRLVDMARKGRPLSEAEEQQVRDFYGYAPSESRTWKERQAAAQQIMRSPPPEPDWLDGMVAGYAEMERAHREKQKAYRAALRRQQAVPHP